VPKATQLNLNLDNQTGTLARLCRDLAHGGVNLLALMAPETHTGRGVIRLLVANPEVARQALARTGYEFTEEQVIFIEIKNRPGALARMTEKLHGAAIGIRYAYATATAKAQKTAAVIVVSAADLDRADRLLGR
jgi:hypothetical protein